jgi:predicted enzyme related to lactoylglutathione lyase
VLHRRLVLLTAFIAVAGLVLQPLPGAAQETPEAAETRAATAEEQLPDIGFSGLATLDIEVRDREEAIAWFSQVLGFEHLFTVEEMNWAEVRCPAAKVTIGMTEVRDRPVRTSGIDFGVNDMEAARRAIEERGGVFLGETTDYGPVLVARLRDPSGNMFNLFKGK